MILPIAVLLAGGANPLCAQELIPVAFGSVSLANLYRTDDRSFGTDLNIGAGGGIEWKRLGVDLEVHRTVGLEPRDAPCATMVPCVGSARDGLLDATMVLGNLTYLFGQSRLRPYVSGSVGLLQTNSVNSLTIADNTTATVTEFREKDTGLATGIGVGVDVPLTPRLSLRPEFRTYWSTAMSRANLGMHRGTVGFRYRW
jgi:hypothetical protein